MTSARFEAVVDSEGDGVFFEIPADLADRVGEGKKRPPVSVTVGGVTYRTTISVYGGKSYIPFRRELRERAGLSVGQRTTVEIRADVAPRMVEVPDDLEAALAENEAASRVFDSLAYTHRKENVAWINSAKRPETRQRRIEETLRKLSQV